MRPLPFFLFVTDAVVNVSERGRRWKEHDEAVKMVNFSRTWKRTKCDLDKTPREITGAGLVELREQAGCPLRRRGSQLLQFRQLLTFKTGLSL